MSIFFSFQSLTGPKACDDSRDYFTLEKGQCLRTANSFCSFLYRLGWGGHILVKEINKITAAVCLPEPACELETPLLHSTSVFHVERRYYCMIVQPDFSYIIALPLP